eukprot:GGOE01000457.1.p5 GENE.GGOE01000457.1~~GGOE01000457.1.p5  ORF type:complete len:108 (-),score=26.76 GGOE01000457.1:218-541(-)
MSGGRKTEARRGKDRHKGGVDEDALLEEALRRNQRHSGQFPDPNTEFQVTDPSGRRRDLPVPEPPTSPKLRKGGCGKGIVICSPNPSGTTAVLLTTSLGALPPRRPK